MIFNARGFGLVQVLITSTVLTVVGMGAATVMNNTLNSNKITASRSENATLLDALRVQLARRSTCASSFAQPPAQYGNDTEVAVNLGTIRVQAGADLVDYRLAVRSLAVRGVQQVGTTNSGNRVFVGTLTVQTQSRAGDAGPAFSMKPTPAAQLTFEVQGANTLVGCYASDAGTNQVQQLNTFCSNIVSTDGQAGYFFNGHCRVPDVSGPVKCGQLGGTWTGSRCAITPNIFFVNRVVGYGSPGNTYYGAICPPGSSITGVACYAQNGPLPAVNTALFGNGGYCWWQSGNESTEFVVQASCSP